MDDYFSISRAIFRSEQSGSVCDTLSLEDKFCYEKIYNKYCKYILGLKKIARNISAKSELGRFPITDYIKTQAILRAFNIFQVYQYFTIYRRYFLLRFEPFS